MKKQILEYAQTIENLSKYNLSSRGLYLEFTMIFDGTNYIPYYLISISDYKFTIQSKQYIEDIIKFSFYEITKIDKKILDLCNKDNISIGEALLRNFIFLYNFNQK